ncbi:DKNYY domain-containing protein [Capnocytophaga sp. G2]|uniref:DKNYY domain-containing protein n=1 Tax=Capnocytophaga sp. G2 TaxID=3110695 RepID=UPI002B4A82D2|nr:DKNYY domain-containing protein [Capnocytophaga sp. G2]MEB3004761.1 DKNYY domain-containing protein [Capnocytophaga sp. G2]
MVKDVRPNMILLSRIVMISLVGIIVLSLLLLFSSISDKDYSLERNIDNHRIGVSNFYNYKGKIYVAIPGSGHVEIPEADPLTFEVFSQNNNARQIGWDKSHVFCGDEIIPHLRTPITSLGNDLFTDGKMTYYCAWNTESKESFAISSIIGQILYILHLNKKPTYYYHPIKLMADDGRKFFSIKNSPFISTDGSSFYYQGERIEGAKDSLFPIVSLKDYQDKLKHSITSTSDSHYFSNGKQVFYKTKLLDIPYRNDLVTGSFSSWGSFEILYSLNGGKIFIDGKDLNPDTSPYHLLTLSDTYSEHVFFTNKNGVYFYDNENKKARKASSENVFKNYKEIEEGYFSNGEDLLFFLSDEKWGRRRNPGLKSYTTKVCMLQTQAKGTWHKWEEAGNLPIWQKGNEWYFLDYNGIRQGIKEGVYRITNKETFNARTEKEGFFYSSKVEKMINEGIFVPANYQVLFKAKTQLADKFSSDLLWILLIVVVIGLSTYFLLKKFNFNTDPFILEENTLRINNFIGKRYPIYDIHNVLFSIGERGQNGLIGKMKIISRNGKTSSEYRFLSTLFVLSDTEEAITKKIKELQKELARRGIQSQLLKE